jgi:hypothetical protein
VHGVFGGEPTHLELVRSDERTHVSCEFFHAWMKTEAPLGLFECVSTAM